MSKLGIKTGKQSNPRGTYTTDQRINLFIKRNNLVLNPKQLCYIKQCYERFELNSYIFGYIKSFIEFNLNFWPNRIKRILKNPKAITKLKMYLMYGKVEGLNRWNSYCARQAYTNSAEYKNMSKTEFNEYNKSRAITLDNLIEKHGKVEGLNRWNSYCARQAYTNSLEYFQKKFGDKVGLDNWKRINKIKGHSLESYRLRFGNEFGEIKYSEYIKTRTNYYSKISQELFEHIKDENSLYATKSGEFMIKGQNQYYFYDFVDPIRMKCIEFNGDYWHKNPNFYDKDLYTEIHNRDIIKNEEIQKLGFDVLVIWENDYKTNKDGIIQHCKEFIYGKN